jgi:hypothetical protein
LFAPMELSTVARTMLLKLKNPLPEAAGS